MDTDKAAAQVRGPDEAVEEYLTAFYTGDFERARAVVAPEFSFRGPFLTIEGRDEFFSGAQGLQPIVRGHRLLRRWVDGEEVCSIYEVTFETPAGGGVIPMSEWHSVRDGLLTAGRVLFDTAAFRVLMPQPAVDADSENVRHDMS